jgi:hypothetical protein
MMSKMLGLFVLADIWLGLLKELDRIYMIYRISWYTVFWQGRIEAGQIKRGMLEWVLTLSHE